MKALVFLICSFIIFIHAISQKTKKLFSKYIYKTALGKNNWKFFKKEVTYLMKKILVLLVAAILATSVVACDDAPGEDEIGDGEINDEE